MTDAELIPRYVDQADTDAFRALVDRHVHFVHATARRRCPQEADDVTQAVFMVLARKARQLRGRASLAGWLYRTTLHCCANARKLAARRQKHERHAAAARPTATLPAHASDDAAELLPLLDDALAALPAKYREVILLRYLEGRSSEDASEALGLTDAALRKRASRGLERLRDYFGRRGITLSAAAVTATLVAQAQARASDTVVASSGAAASTGGSSAAAALAGSASIPTGLLTVAALLTVAVAAIAAVTLTAGGSPPTATPPATAVLTPHAEAASPGQTVVTRFDLLLETATAESVRAATAPAEGARASFLEVRRGDAAGVFEALRGAYSDGRVVADGTQMSHTTLPERWPGGRPYALYVPQFWNDFHRGTQVFTISLTWNGQNGATITQTPQGLQLGLNSPAIETFVQEYSYEPRERRNGGASIDYATLLQPGEAVILLGRYSLRGGADFTSVHVWHAYRATEAQFQKARRVQRAPAWVQHGPAGVVALADRATEWGGDGRLAIEDTPDRWTRTLANGATVRLLAVGRPARWPFCWWDADGRAVPNDWTDATATLEAELAVSVSVDLPTPPKEDEPYARSWRDGDAYELPVEDRRVEVWVGGGAWKEERFGPGDEIALPGGGWVSFEKVTELPDMPLPLLRGDVGHDVEFYLDAVTKTGERVRPHNDPADAVRVVTSVTEPWETESPNLDVRVDDVDHYVLRWRQRQRAVFEGFAVAPSREPAAP